MELGQIFKNYLLRIPSMRSTAIDCYVRKMDADRIFYKKASPSFREIHGYRLLGSINGAMSSFQKTLALRYVHEVHSDRLLGSTNGARPCF